MLDRTIALAVALSLGVAACKASSSGDNGKDPSKVTANHLENPSFEDGRAPWFSLVESSPYWMDFAVTDAHARSGQYSAMLNLHSRGEIRRGTRVWGVLNDLKPKFMPQRIAGFYRVEEWHRGTAKQYVQVVVSIGFGRTQDPLQVAWVLCGIDAQPFPIANRKFIFAGPKEPTQDEWVPFEVDVHDALRREWGVHYPATLSFDAVRILFEARFDGYEDSDGPVAGKVYFDDLYFGN
jgi:hypothetical protein